MSGVVLSMFNPSVNACHSRMTGITPSVATHEGQDHRQCKPRIKLQARLLFPHYILRSVAKRNYLQSLIIPTINYLQSLIILTINYLQSLIIPTINYLQSLLISIINYLQSLLVSTINIFTSTLDSCV